MTQQTAGQPHDPTARTPRWFPIAGIVFAAFALMFFTALAVASAFGRSVPPDSHFIVVVILALSSALSCFFFGGQAIVNYSLPNTLSFGRTVTFSATGGIAVLFIVLLLGRELYPQPHEPFTVVVRPYSTEVPRFQNGSITLECGNFHSTVNVNSNGEAEFASLPIEYKGKRATILTRIYGYEVANGNVQLNDGTIQIFMKPVETLLTGAIDPIPRGKNVRVLVDDVSQPAVPDQYGRFQMIVHKPTGEHVHLEVWIDQVEVGDAIETLPGPFIVPIKY